MQWLWLRERLWARNNWATFCSFDGVELCNANGIVDERFSRVSWLYVALYTHFCCFLDYPTPFYLRLWAFSCCCVCLLTIFNWTKWYVMHSFCMIVSVIRVLCWFFWYLLCSLVILGLGTSHEDWAAIKAPLIDCRAPCALRTNYAMHSFCMIISVVRL